MQAFYKPLREVGGDYFDVIELPANRTLFALADVSGKGIPAALRAANIQALVRSIASVESSPLALANQINKHLTRGGGGGGEEGGRGRKGEEGEKKGARRGLENIWGGEEGLVG